MGVSRSVKLRKKEDGKATYDSFCIAFGTREVWLTRPSSTIATVVSRYTASLANDATIHDWMNQQHDLVVGSVSFGVVVQCIPVVEGMRTPTESQKV